VTPQELAEIRARSADEENWIFLSDDMCQIGLDRRALLRYVDALTAERDELVIERDAERRGSNNSWDEVKKLRAKIAPLRAERDEVVRALVALSDAAGRHGGGVGPAAWNVVRALLARLAAEEKP